MACTDPEFFFPMGPRVTFVFQNEWVDLFSGILLHVCAFHRFEFSKGKGGGGRSHPYPSRSAYAWKSYSASVNLKTHIFWYLCNFYTFLDRLCIERVFARTKANSFEMQMAYHESIISLVFHSGMNVASMAKKFLTIVGDYIHVYLFSAMIAISIARMKYIYR